MPNSTFFLSKKFSYFLWVNKRPITNKIHPVDLWRREFHLNEFKRKKYLLFWIFIWKKYSNCYFIELSKDFFHPEMNDSCFNVRLVSLG
jgi:hypothetical protein